MDPSVPNLSDVSQLVWSSMPSEFLTNFSFLFTVAKAISIVFLVYLIFLIIQSFIKMRQALRIRSIEQNLIEINHKLDAIIPHKKASKEKH